MPALLDDVRFAFQSLFNLNTGGVVAVEALARPHDGSVQGLCEATGSLVVAETWRPRLSSPRCEKLGVRPAQGNMLAAAQRRPWIVATISGVLGEINDPEAVATTATEPLRRKAGPNVTGSWVLGRPNSDHVDVLRGCPHPAAG